MRKLLVVLFIVLFATSAHAENGAGTDKYLGGAPVKVGWGKYYYKGLIHAYDAGLYSSDGKYDAAKPFALELTYQTDIDGKDIADKSLEEMKKVATIDKAKGDAWLKEMTAIFPDVDEGVTLTGVNVPGKGVVFLKNGAKIGEINDPAYATAFFGIWLSDKTPSPALKAKLLGQNAQ